MSIRPRMLSIMLSLHLATISPISQRLKNRGALRLNGILHVLLRFLTKSARFVALYCALLRSSPRFASRSVTLCCDQHDWLPRSTTFRYVLLRSPTTKPLCCDLLRFDLRFETNDHVLRHDLIFKQEIIHFRLIIRNNEPAGYRRS